MSVATMIDGVLKRERNTVRWVSVYVAIVSTLGFGTAVLAFASYKGQWGVLFLFVGIGVVSKLVNVKLFAKSRSTISLGFVVAMAAMMTLGPWGGVLTHLATGAATIVPQYLAWNQKKTRLRSMLKKAFFNMSMGVLSTACSGQIYLWLGGTPGMIHWSSALPLILAVITDTFINMSLLMTVIRLETGRQPAVIWTEDWQWALPITISSGIIGGGALAIAYQVADILGLALFTLPVLATGYAFQLYVNNLRSYVDQLEVANQQLNETNLSLLHTLGTVIDAYDMYTFGHSAQVAQYAGAIAEAMNLSSAEQTDIVRGALIHDIGKVGVTDAIVGKPDRLTREEYEIMKLHTVIGAEIVSQIPLLRHLAPLARNHHERWDGLGYPDGLKGDESLLAARILAVADSVDVMLSDRPYQAARSLEEVVAEVVRCSGKQYDPAVVTAFLAVVNTKGKDFFINSAAKVAQELTTDGATVAACRVGYAKRSMAHQVKLPVG